MCLDYSLLRQLYKYLVLQFEKDTCLALTASAHFQLIQWYRMLTLTPCPPCMRIAAIMSHEFSDCSCTLDSNSSTVNL